MFTSPRDPRNFNPGMYRHARSGTICIAEQLVRHHETGELYVVYVSLDGATSDHQVPHRLQEWATNEAWTDLVWIDGQASSRFVKLGLDGQVILPCVSGCTDPQVGVIVIYQIDTARRDQERLLPLVRQGRVNDEFFFNEAQRAHLDACVACRDATDDLMDVLRDAQREGC
jgi:hypothetical protein